MLFRRLKTFFLLPRRTQWLFINAIFISAIVKITLTSRPFKKVLHWLGKINTESDMNPDRSSQQLRTDIKVAVELSDKYTFWKTECYTLSITCKLLLKKYNLPSTIYIGFYKDEAGNYKGHAWLRSYDMILTGDKEIEKFTVQSFFS